MKKKMKKNCWGTKIEALCFLNLNINLSLLRLEKLYCWEKGKQKLLELLPESLNESWKVLFAFIFIICTKSVIFRQSSHSTQKCPFFLWLWRDFCHTLNCNLTKLLFVIFRKINFCPGFSPTVDDPKQSIFLDYCFVRLRFDWSFSFDTLYYNEYHVDVKSRNGHWGK